VSDSIAQPVDRGLCEEHIEDSETGFKHTSEYSYHDEELDNSFFAVIHHMMAEKWAYSVHAYVSGFDSHIDGTCVADDGTGFDCAHAIVMSMWALAQEAMNEAS